MRHACCLLLWVGLCTAAAPPAETPAQHDARMQWWREARFGLFIHWGVYSVPAGFRNGKPVGGGEWIMNVGKIPCAEYQQYAKQFNPVKYDPEAWVRLAQEAGMKYIVITAKHHDGFALFDSKASDWNVVKATPYGRDLLAPLAAACRKHHLKLGFYYSQAQDWNNGGSASGGKWDKAQERDFDDYLQHVALPQVRELLTNYGPLAILWWDTPHEMTKERAAPFLPELLRQPGIITNDRLGGGFGGDSATPEQHIPATGLGSRDWETCMTMNNHWGYVSNDPRWKSPETLIHNLVDIASKGGNYLLNVGPTSEGLIPEPSVERLKAVGAWMKVNGPAIYATTASPFKHLAWGRCTKKLTQRGATLFLQVFNWPADGRLVLPGLRNKPEGAKLLANPKRHFKLERDGEDVVVWLTGAAPDPISSTVVVQIQGAPDVQPYALTQAADGKLALPAAEAVVHGSKLMYEQGHERDNLGYWVDAKDWAEWPVNITQPGRYTVEIEVAGFAASRLELSLGGSKLVVTAPVTGDYGKFKTVDAGVLDLPAGRGAVAVRPVTAGWQPINLKAVRFRPGEVK